MEAVVQLPVVSSELALDTYAALDRARNRIDRLIGSALEPLGLSQSGLKVLEVVRAEGGHVPLMVIYRYLRMSKANATEVVQTLERAGLVERMRMRRDRRCTEVRLTDYGAEVAREAAAVRNEVVRNAFAAFAPLACQQLTELCRFLGD